MTVDSGSYVDIEAKPFVSAIQVYKRPTRKFDSEDDRGSVQNCYSCGFAYFSRWETHRAWSHKKLAPDPSELVCERCVTKSLFVRNIKALKAQHH